MSVIKRQLSGTAKVKESTTWIYAGHTFKILSKREPTEHEVDYGAEYKLSLIDTPFQNRYPTSPYTFIYAKDLEINEVIAEVDPRSDTLVKLTISTLYTIYNAGFNHGVNEGTFPEHGTFEAFERLIRGESPMLDGVTYAIQDKINLADW